MTSSSFCELALHKDGAELFHAAADWDALPREVEERPRIPSNRSVELTVRREGHRTPLRVLLEGEELMQLAADRERWTLQLGEALRDQFGQAEVVVEAPASRSGQGWRRVLSVMLRIEADPAFQRLHEALVDELEQVDIALARDVASRSWQRGDGRPPDAAALRVENDLEHLWSIYARLEHGLKRMAEQPTRILHSERELGRWRPGDTLSPTAVQRLVLDGSVRRDAGGRLLAPSKALLDRARLATDIEEHRHIRAGIQRLAERTGAVARYCGRAIGLLQQDEGRWSEAALRQKIEPKVYKLAITREKAHDLQERVRRLVGQHAFLADVSAPRTPFGPTPIFLGRPAYREVYRALLETRRCAGGRYAQEGLRVRFRSISTLYEYWLFVRAIGLLGEMFGPPVNHQGFSLIDEFYRPELAPGQQFRFRLPHGDALTASYEPDFPPLGARTRSRWRSAMVSAPLRPDVTLELSTPGRPPAILALDAKSGPRFRKAQERLLSNATYLALIHDPASGHQPVRQLFLVHRDADAAPVCNLTGYLEGRVSSPDARVLGAVPAQPGFTQHLENVVLRFLETFRARKWR